MSFQGQKVNMMPGIIRQGLETKQKACEQCSRNELGNPCWSMRFCNNLGQTM